MKAFVVVVCVLIVSVTVGVKASYAQASRATVDALNNKKLTELVQTHPDEAVRVGLFNRLVRKEVVFLPTYDYKQFGVNHGTYNNQYMVFILFNPTYLHSVQPGQSAADHQSDLQLALLHEAIHVEDHFKGTIRIGAIEGSASLPLARALWLGEWRATLEEWKAAKKWGKTYLLGRLHESTRLKETPRTYLDGYYMLLLGSEHNQQIPGINRYLTIVYQEEVAKLSR